MELDIYQKLHIVWLFICWLLLGYICLCTENLLDWAYNVFVIWVVGHGMVWMSDVLKRG